MNLKKNAPAEAVVVDESATGSNKRVLVAGGIAAGLAVVAAMSYVLLSGGSGDTATGVVATPKRTATAQPSAAPTAAPSAPAIKKFNGSNARDPFKALVVEPVAAAPGGAAGSGSPVVGGASGGGSPATTAPSPTAPPTVPSTAPTPVTPSVTSKPRSADPVTISLVSVASNDTSANFTLNTKAYKGVKPQATFGTYFKLLNLTQGKCGAVQYGDVTFEMCKGDSLTLR